MSDAITLKPQPGPQEQFLSTPADIAIYGGAAGGGKSFALLLEPTRHINNPKFGAVVFRRNMTQITNEGGLWDTALNIYPHLGAIERDYKHDFVFPSSASITFSHLELEKTVHNWQGSQIPLIGFDELTHFTEYQFFYMLSRNRSMSGVKPYIRATTNPDADSWVAEFISWWICQETGFPISREWWDVVDPKWKGVERSGVLRWMVRVNDEILWYDTKEEAEEAYPKIPPKSVTFIPSSVYDNKILLNVDPSYIANLYALTKVEQERLLRGNWKIRASGGRKFKKEFFEIVDDYPRKFKKICRYWDFAATEPKKTGKDPDWTVGTKMGIDYDDMVWIIDQVRVRETPGKVEKTVKNTASQDGKRPHIIIEEEPGSSGKFTSNRFIKLLRGYVVKADRPTGNKEVRANPYASYAEAGNIKIVRGPWNKVFLDEHEAFPNPDVHDDTVDSASGGFKYLTEKPVSVTEATARKKRVMPL